jgi:hypothetical protein
VSLKRKSLAGSLALRLRAARGQAMLEYSMISHMILIGGFAGAWPFTQWIFASLTKYFHSIYYVLTSPVP